MAYTKAFTKVTDETATGDSKYKMKLGINVTDAVTTKRNSVVTLRLLLMRTGGYERKQHNTKISFKYDNKDWDSEWSVVPDDNAKAGVEAAGKLYMNKNEWYQWGPAKTFTIPNDGALHSFEVKFEIDGVKPYYGNAKLTYQFPKYAIVPGKPTSLNNSFDSATRVLTYSWVNGVNCDTLRLYRKLYDEKGDVIREGHLLNNDYPYAFSSISEVLPDNTTSVVWQVYSKSSTGNEEGSGAKQVSIEAYSKVWVNVPGVGFKKAIPWVKVGGEWKKCLKTYVKVGSTWKRTSF